MNPAESPIVYPFNTLPAPGATLCVAPGVYWVRMPLPFALDHINLWLLEDGRQWAIVDCGIGNEATRGLWTRVFADKLGEAGVSKIIVTHHHPDHAGNAGWLTQRFAAPMWMSQGEYLSAHALCDGSSGLGREQLASHYLKNGLDTSHAPGILNGRENYRRSVPDFPTSFRRMLEGDLIRIGPHQWQVIMGYGHAPEHASLYCASLGVFISGDMVLPRISTNISVPASQPEADPLRQFLTSLTRYESLPKDTLVLPSHGQVFRGMHERIAQLKEHHRLRLGELLDACTSPKSAADVLGVLFKRSLDNHQMMFAMGEAMAHLHYLREEGTLTQSMINGVVHYRRNTSGQAGIPGAS